MVALDLTGKTFNLLTAIRFVGRSSSGSRLWECSCSCARGRLVIVTVGNLCNGHSKSCGCKKSEAASRNGKMSWVDKRINARAELVGKKIAGVIIIGIYYDGRKAGSGGSLARAICKCNNVFVARLSFLKTGHTKTCGCLSRNVTTTLNYRRHATNRLLNFISRPSTIQQTYENTNSTT